MGLADPTPPLASCGGQGWSGGGFWLEGGGDTIFLNQGPLIRGGLCTRGGALVLTMIWCLFGKPRDRQQKLNFPTPHRLLQFTQEEHPVYSELSWSGLHSTVFICLVFTYAGFPKNTKLTGREGRLFRSGLYQLLFAFFGNCTTTSQSADDVQASSAGELWHSG